MSALSGPVAAFLDAHRVGVLATVSEAGRPRQSVVYYAREGDRLRIAFDRDGRMTRERLVHPRDGLPRWDNHLTSVNLKPVDPKIV